MFIILHTIIKIRAKLLLVFLELKVWKNMVNNGNIIITINYWNINSLFVAIDSQTLTIY